MSVPRQTSGLGILVTFVALMLTGCPEEDSPTPSSTGDAVADAGQETSGSDVTTLDADATTGTPDADATTGTPDADATTGTPDADATTGTPDADATSGTPDADATSGTPDADATAGTPDADATSGAPDSDATSGTPDADAAAGTPDADASSGTPDADAAAGTPDADASSGTPDADASTGTPDADAISTPDADAVIDTSVPDGTGPELPPEDTGTGSENFAANLVTKTTLNVDVTPFDLATYQYRSLAHPQPWEVYAYEPHLVLATDENQNIALGVHDVADNTIVAIDLDASLQPGTPKTLASNAARFTGFDVAATGYAVAWVDDDGESLYVSETDTAGAAQFQTQLTATAGLDDLWSKQSPMRFGSGRVAFDAAHDRIAVYLSHRMLWDDNVKHQGGLLKFIDGSGTILGGMNNWGGDSAGGDNWLYSHNFDQRLWVHGDELVLLGLGDAYPRAITFRRQVGSSVNLDEEVFDIPGSIGDNDTMSQLGALVVLPDGGYLVVFTTEAGREARDVAIVAVSAGGQAGAPVWLTEHTAGQGINAINAKAAVWGSTVLVAWETVGLPTQPWVPTNDHLAHFVTVDAQGVATSSPVEVPAVRLPRGDDWVTLPSGEVAWATGEGSEVNLYRVTLP